MSLIVVCSHCLTWVEPHADRCTECGVAVDVDAADPDDVLLAERLGEVLVDLGPVRLERSGWPDHGQLVGTSEGLLFAPRLQPRANGSVEAVGAEPHAVTPWWMLWLSHRSHPPADQNARPLESGLVPSPLRSTVELLHECPGALFVQRTSIHRALVQWGRLRIVRPPSRSVTFIPTTPGQTVRQLMRPLLDHAPWRNLISGL